MFTVCSCLCSVQREEIATSVNLTFEQMMPGEVSLAGWKSDQVGYLHPLFIP